MGWINGLDSVLKKVFDLQVGHSILAASLVLSIMIFPSITSVASDAIRAVSKKREWQLMDLAQHAGKQFIVL